MLSQQAQDFLQSHQGKRIVFTNGCFDIIHRGHIAYLNQAKAEGDLLFIGLNSDASVKRLKGESRPVNSQEDRKFVLENLRMVDFVEVFEEDTPVELIKKVKPQLFVKGGDYDVTQIPEYPVVKDLGGEVKKLDFVEGHSTTNIIERMKK